ncbi:MAG: acetyl-CoA carboxylase biotin carboxylase subunit [Chloroflexi bacterium]|nr:acetyl-CoA carboxylase biotin carboxylase subunit [Chloroflexota bacterium]MCL5947447.1 acetyl-CoA carboxylase biotin carboxylase subunit [Chloroflexota bacterium]
MFSRLFIANRGEIAVRVVRCCRELSIESIVAFSEADRDSLAVKMADHAVCIGPAVSSKSYLNIPNIVQAALLTGAEAIHPGAGFLAEDPRLAEVCERYGLVFIGPPGHVLRAVGEKTLAKQRMRAAGLPVIAGTDNPVRSVDQALAAAKEIGYPIMLKPAGGGGGKGMRIVTDSDELERSFPLSQSESLASFNNDGIYLERYQEGMRHVEVQVLADHFGNVITLGERNCSVQRFHQKLIEEAPSPNLPEWARQELWESAVRGARAIDYIGAGTFEFLVDEEHHHYFLEINKRIQVEHPVTEAITGIDLVKAQLTVAAHEPLPWRQEDVTFHGHAIECRVNAEDPTYNFQAQTGRVSEYLPPGGPGIRVDSHLYAGYVVSPYYDSLLSKVIAWGSTRTEMVARALRALDESIIGGITTNREFLRWILTTREFTNGTLTTQFVTTVLRDGLPPTSLGGIGMSPVEG